jgi:hypothetical protein
MTELARTSSNCKRQTRLLVRESDPHQQTSNCLTVIKILLAPDGCFIPRQTGRLESDELVVDRRTETVCGDGSRMIEKRWQERN